MEKMVFYWGIIFSVAIVCMELVKHLDENLWEWSAAEYMCLFGCSGVSGFVIWQVEEGACAERIDVILLSVLGGCLLFACMTDCKCCEAFAFTWWIAGSVAGILVLQSSVEAYRVVDEVKTSLERQLIPLLLFSFMQEFFFERFYGKADCHAFVVCAVAECALGMGMREFLLHMLMAFGLLTVVQARQGNISSKGDLKKPVAFLPYITISFWVLLFLEKSVILKRISETNLIGGL